MSVGGRSTSDRLKPHEAESLLRLGWARFWPIDGMLRKSCERTGPEIEGKQCEPTMPIVAGVPESQLNPTYVPLKQMPMGLTILGYGSSGDS